MRGWLFHASNLRLDVIMESGWLNNWQGYESHIVVWSNDRVKHKIASELWMLHSKWLRPNT